MKKTSKTNPPIQTSPAASPKKTKAPAKSAASVAVKPAARAPRAAAPAVKSKAPEPTVTTVIAQIDVGFGNALFIRGEGPGLSWEKGAQLDCVADDKWSFSLADAGAPVVFKLLVNDLTWSVGDDYVVTPGREIVVTPSF